MSRLRGTRDLKVASLRMPGRWRDKLDVANVAGLADQLRAGKTLPPIRVTPALEVVQGFHRVAAHQDVGLRTVRCDVVEYADELEQEEDHLAENLRRRILPPEERQRSLARLVEIARTRAGDDADDFLGEVDPSPGASRESNAPQPTSVGRAALKQQAVEDVASKVGVSPRTVERAVAKEAERHALPAASAPGNGSHEPPPPPIRTFGVPLPDDVGAGAVEAQALLAVADRLLQQAQAALTKLVGEPGNTARGFNRGLAQDLHQRVHEVGALVRASKPVALCPWCKALPGISCMSCAGSGVATEGRMGAGKGVPEDLLKEGDAAQVTEHGQYKLYEQASRKTGRNGKAAEVRR